MIRDVFQERKQHAFLSRRLSVWQVFVSFFFCSLDGQRRLSSLRRDVFDAVATVRPRFPPTRARCVSPSPAKDTGHPSTTSDRPTAVAGFKSRNIIIRLLLGFSIPMSPSSPMSHFLFFTCQRRLFSSFSFSFNSPVLTAVRTMDNRIDSLNAPKPLEKRQQKNMYRCNEKGCDGGGALDDAYRP